MLLCGAMAAFCFGSLPPARSRRTCAARQAGLWWIRAARCTICSIIAGEILVMKLMQTTCPHCAAFADILGQIPQKYGDKVAFVIAVASIPQDNGKTVQDYVAGHKVTYPIVFDAGQMQYSYVLKPHVDLPCVYVIDANGYIRADYMYGLTTQGHFRGQGVVYRVGSAGGGDAEVVFIPRHGAFAAGQALMPQCRRRHQPNSPCAIRSRTISRAAECIGITSCVESP